MEAIFTNIYNIGTNYFTRTERYVITFLFDRLFIISLFPNLRHLDDRTVTEDQVKEAIRLYKRPLIERVSTKTATSLPDYIRFVSEKVSGLLAANTSEAKGKNFIV